MRHLYALAGKTYPIPDKGQKIKNYEFMVANGATGKQAMAAIFPTAKTADHRTNLQKNIDGYKEAVKAGDKDTMAIYEAKFAKDSYIKPETSTDPEVVKLNNALKDLDPSSKEYKNIQGQIDKINYITPSKRGEYLDLLAQQKLVSTDSKEWKDLEARKLKLTEQSTKDKEHSLALKERNALDPNSPTYAEDYKRITARMNKLEDISKTGNQDPTGSNRRAKTHTYIRDNKLDSKDTRITQEHIDGTYPLNLNTDKNSQAYKTELKELNSLDNATSKIATAVDMVNETGFDKNVVNDTVTYIKKVGGDLKDKIWSSKDPDDVKDREEYLAKLGTTSYLGQILADYMKSISGTAIADKEYERLSKIFGGGTYADKTALLASLDGFVRGAEDSIENRAMGLGYEVPDTTLRLRKKVQEARIKRTWESKKLASGNMAYQDPKTGKWEKL